MTLHTSQGAMTLPAGPYDRMQPCYQAETQPCSHRPCPERIDEDATRCEECRERFCAGHLTRSVHGYSLCPACVAREQAIQGTSRLSLQMILDKSAAGGYLTDEDLREAIQAWRLS